MMFSLCAVNGTAETTFRRNKKGAVAGAFLQIGI